MSKSNATIHLEILNERQAIALNRNTTAAQYLIGRYTVPTFNQVCMVTSDEHVSSDNRNFRIYPRVIRNQRTKELLAISPLRDALMYGL